jgi:hypothetical protein
MSTVTRYRDRIALVAVAVALLLALLLRTSSNGRRHCPGC